jgi:hypothetical protein
LNSKTIIAIIIAIVAVMLIWTYIHSPERQLRPAAAMQSPPPEVESGLQAVFSQVICPLPECKANDETLTQCDCETAIELKKQIEMMLSKGLTAQGVLAHLKMMGLVEGDPGLPEGHPPLGEMKKDTTGGA